MKMTIVIIWAIFVTSGGILLLLGAQGHNRDLENRITKLEQELDSIRANAPVRRQTFTFPEGTWEDEQDQGQTPELRVRETYQFCPYEP